MKLSERDIQKATYWNLYKKGHRPICPNYTPHNWPWECDMFSLTKTLRFIEHEIKISRADFKADSKKIEKLYRWETIAGQAARVKHDLLKVGDLAGPSKFSYVVPEGLISAEEVPDWAGLLYCMGTCLREIKKAPKLHDSPVDENVIQHVNGVFYFRYWNLRNGPAPSELEPEFSI